MQHQHSRLNRPQLESQRKSIHIAEIIAKKASNQIHLKTEHSREKYEMEREIDKQ